MKAIGMIAMLLALGALACDKPAEKTSTTTQPATSGAATGSPTSTVAAGDEGVATEEDFEDEAEQKITAQNAEDELDKLEKEIGAK